jgi:hypothetical protein
MTCHSIVLCLGSWCRLVTLRELALVANLIGAHPSETNTMQRTRQPTTVEE